MCQSSYLWCYYVKIRNELCIYCCLGEVVPVGGVKPGSRESIPIIPGDSFVESLSGKLVRIHGGYLKDTAVLPSAGGFQALLDSSVMACEARVNDAVRQYKEALISKFKDGQHFMAFHTSSVAKWLGLSLRVWEVRGSIPGRVKPTISNW